MPSPSKPKKFVAATDFTYRHQRYKPGDPVDDRRVIDRLVRYGDRFIVAKRSKSASAETPTAESVKED